MNNYIDWDIDPIMKRTKSRPIVTGTFKQRHVLTISLSFIIVGEILLFIVALATGMWGLLEL
ncbi:UbiA family prenyltransferase [Ureibacillus sp. NPDC094379]